MKKIIVLWSFCSGIIFAQLAMAECPTGYACLLKDIKHQEAAIHEIQKKSIDEYFDPRVTEPGLKREEEKYEEPSYRDLMPFRPRFY